MKTDRTGCRGRLGSPGHSEQALWGAAVPPGPARGCLSWWSTVASPVLPDGKTNPVSRVCLGENPGMFLVSVRQVICARRGRRWPPSSWEERPRIRRWFLHWAGLKWLSGTESSSHGHRLRPSGAAGLPELQRLLVTIQGHAEPGHPAVLLTPTACPVVQTGEPYPPVF